MSETSEATSIHERLVRIESQVQVMREEMTQSRALMERLVRLEENRVADREALKRIFRRLDAQDEEMQSLRTLRTVCIWLGSLLTAVVIGVAVRVLT